MSTKKTISPEILEKLSPEGRKKVERASRIIEKVLEEEVGEIESFEEYERTILEITNEIARRQLARKSTATGG